MSTLSLRLRVAAEAATVFKFESAGNSQTLPSFGWYEYCGGEMKKSNLKFEEAGCQACPDGQLSLPGSTSISDCTSTIVPM